MRHSGTVADMTDDESTPGTPDARDDRRPSSGASRRWLLPVVSALILVAGLVVLGLGVAHSRGVERTARDRDAAVDVASQVLINAYSFDYRDVDSALDTLREASTGEFLDQQQQWSTEVKDRVVEQKAVTSATIGNAAVEEFDDDAGTAKVLFVFTARSERAELPPVTGRQAAVVHVTRIDDSWKVSQIVPVGVVVPVGESSASVRDLQDPTATAAPGDGSGPARTSTTPAQKSTATPAPTTGSGAAPSARPAR